MVSLGALIRASFSGSVAVATSMYALHAFEKRYDLQPFSMQLGHIGGTGQRAYLTDASSAEQRTTFMKIRDRLEAEQQSPSHLLRRVDPYPSKQYVYETVAMLTPPTLLSLYAATRPNVSLRARVRALFATGFFSYGMRMVLRMPTS